MEIFPEAVGTTGLSPMRRACDTCAIAGKNLLAWRWVTTPWSAQDGSAPGPTTTDRHCRQSTVGVSRAAKALPGFPVGQLLHARQRNCALSCAGYARPPPCVGAAAGAAAPCDPVHSAHISVVELRLMTWPCGTPGSDRRLSSKSRRTWLRWRVASIQAYSIPHIRGMSTDPSAASRAPTPR